MDEEKKGGLFNHFCETCKKYGNKDYCPTCENWTRDCVICKEVFLGYGNNAEPVAIGECCDECNIAKVLPMRLSQLARGEFNSTTEKEVKE